MVSKANKNLALEVKLFKNISDRIDFKVVTVIKIPTRNKWCVAGGYLSFFYVLSLRGHNNFEIDIKELIRYLEMKKDSVWIIHLIWTG